MLHQVFNREIINKNDTTSCMLWDAFWVPLSFYIYTPDFTYKKNNKNDSRLSLWGKMLTINSL